MNTKNTTESREKKYVDLNDEEKYQKTPIPEKKTYFQWHSGFEESSKKSFSCGTIASAFLEFNNWPEATTSFLPGKNTKNWKIIASSEAELVCVRSWPEYIGEVSGYNYIKPKGRIPGAVFADCGSDAYHMENYRNIDHTTREYHEIAENWAKNGITPDKHLAFYCGTGWRGSEAWFNAWLMGWPNVSLYDGGWFEWSADPENPFETGVPEQYKVMG